MPTDHSPLNEAIVEAANTIGVRSGPAVADAIIAQVFPKTLRSAQGEGAEHILRNGLIAHVARVLKGSSASSAQSDFAAIDATFGEYIKPLKSQSYFVPSREEYVSISDLIARPAEIKEAADALRRHGQDCIVEAERLDRLHEAVTGNVHTPSNDDEPGRTERSAA